MQEAIEQKTVALTTQATKFTAKLMYDMMKQYLENETEKHGEKSIKELRKQGQGLERIDIPQEGLQEFKKSARKHNVDFSVLKEKGTDPPIFHVYFKARDEVSINSAMTEALENMVKNQTKEPLKDKIERVKEQGLKQTMKEAFLGKVEEKEATSEQADYRKYNVNATLETYQQLNAEMNNTDFDEKTFAEFFTVRKGEISEETKTLLNSVESGLGDKLKDFFNNNKSELTTLTTETRYSPDGDAYGEIEVSTVIDNLSLSAESKEDCLKQLQSLVEELKPAVEKIQSMDSESIDTLVQGDNVTKGVQVEKTESPTNSTEAKVPVKLEKTANQVKEPKVERPEHIDYVENHARRLQQNYKKLNKEIENSGFDNTIIAEYFTSKDGDVFGKHLDFFNNIQDGLGKRLKDFYETSTSGVSMKNQGEYVSNLQGLVTDLNVVLEKMGTMETDELVQLYEGKPNSVLQATTESSVVSTQKTKEEEIYEHYSSLNEKIKEPDFDKEAMMRAFTNKGNISKTVKESLNSKVSGVGDELQDFFKKGNTQFIKPYEKINDKGAKVVNVRQFAGVKMDETEKQDYSNTLEGIIDKLAPTMEKAKDVGTQAPIKAVDKKESAPSLKEKAPLKSSAPPKSSDLAQKLDLAKTEVAKELAKEVAKPKIKQKEMSR